MKVTSISFEVRYSDDSGIDKAVHYKAGPSKQVRIQRGDDYVAFDVEDIEWLREALLDVLQEAPIEKQPATETGG